MNRAEAEDFLYREARMLDEGRLADWYALTTDDIEYWVPINRDDADPRQHVSIVYDDGPRLRARIWRSAESGFNHSQDPQSETVRIVSNVEVEPAAATGEVTVHCALLLCEYRPGSARRDAVPRTFAARCRYRLRPAGGDWKIAYKKVSLLAMDGALPAMTFVL
ncbi:MAG: aromatic-ring-hydroxylating dioxygenase subunit beta [Candidatus Lustribacter sp.]